MLKFNNFLSLPHTPELIWHRRLGRHLHRIAKVQRPFRKIRLQNGRQRRPTDRQLNGKNRNLISKILKWKYKSFTVQVID